jgi:6-phosphogluconolactonase
MPATPQIRVFTDPDAVAQAAAEIVAEAAEGAIAERGSFSISLAGGSTPKKLYELLAQVPHRSRIDWPRVHVFFGDERVVPPDHKDSNYRTAREALLSKVPIPGDNVYRMRGEIDPRQAAKEYGLMLKEKFGDGAPDVTLLGMGADGHTLSLFPGTGAVKEREHRVVANYADNSTTGRSWRITMTAPFVNRSRQVLFLVTGADKAKTVSEVLEGPSDPDHLPAQLIAPTAGELIWLLDAAAAGMREVE